ncbi:MAG: hypothetical protein EA376_11175 [Phycisphaeraceae bacterium]|nr:MAG: hypothetical protein EA376_11175 [Phycisphaeraceae bacterium]
MTRNTRTASFILPALAAAILASPVVDAAQNHNSSRSNKVGGISGGSVDIITTGGTGLYLIGRDDLGVVTSGVDFHQVTPPGFSPPLGPSPAPTIPYSTVASLMGIDAAGNVLGQSGMPGSTTMYSEQVISTDPMYPRLASVESTTTSLFNQIITDTDFLAMASKKAAEDKAGKRKAIAAEKSVTYFHANTSAIAELSMRMTELDFYIDVDDIGPGACGVQVHWAFGLGSVVGQSTLFSDNMTWEIQAAYGDAPVSLSLTNETVYNLSIPLDAGHEYWFSVDTYAYSVLVPTPGAIALFAMGGLAAARRRRDR